MNFLKYIQNIGGYEECSNRLAKRSLFSKLVADNICFGFVIQCVSTGGDEHVECGIRLIEIEKIIDEYEIERMSDMGFKNPEANCWLTLYKPITKQSIAKDGLSNRDVYDSIKDFEKNLMGDKYDLKKNIEGCLSNYSKPKWALLPESNALANRLLLFNYLNSNNDLSMLQETIQNAVSGLNLSELAKFSTWIGENARKRGQIQ